MLREATKVLTQKGLIRTRPKIGTQITDRSELLSQITFTMRQAVHTARQLDIQDPDIHRQSVGFHQAIYTAICNHNPQAAYRASQEMFDQVRQYIPQD